MLWREGHWPCGQAAHLDADPSLGVAVAGWVSEEWYKAVELGGAALPGR